MSLFYISVKKKVRLFMEDRYYNALGFLLRALKREGDYKEAIVNAARLIDPNLCDRFFTKALTEEDKVKLGFYNE